VRDAAVLAASIVPAAIWWIWLRLHLGAWFTANQHNAFSSPFRGWWRTLMDAGVHSYSVDPTQNQFGEATIIVAVAAAGLLLVCGLLALRLRTPAAAVFLPLVAIVACLSPAATVYERDLLRSISVTLVLVPFVLAATPLVPAFVRAQRG
jgi:hypothetical protein